MPVSYLVAFPGRSGASTSARLRCRKPSQPVALCARSQLFAILFFALSLMAPARGASGQVSISITKPSYGFNVIPNSTRRIFAMVTNGTTNGVNWSLTSGNATLSATNGAWIDVTAPASGSSCSMSGPSSSYVVSSAAQFTIQAQSRDDNSKTANVTFNVCNPQVNVVVVPFYRTLYAGQQADVQSLVWGSVNPNVTWAITSQPGGGNGTLPDTSNRDTVFSATVAGRYVLTATSVADGTKSATAIMYVTGHTIPYHLTPNQTEPIDCSVDPALTGTTYDVGPLQVYRTLAAVPQPTLAPGSTIRVHNEDTTGNSPTTYHEYVEIRSQGTASQPIRMCGVPDSLGNLPILDEANATGRSDTSIYAAGYGGITMHTPGQFALYPNFNGPEYIVIEGLKIQNTAFGNSYTAPAGGTTQWIKGAACIRYAEVQNAVTVGNEFFNCGNGTFVDFNANNAWGGADLYMLWEGNYIHGNGNPGSYTEHQLYIQGWGQVAQFNRIDGFKAGAAGSNWKSRGLWDIFRYNYLGDGAAREMDLVDVQDATPYMSFEGYLSGGANSFRSLYPADAYTADDLAAAQEVWHSHFVYGNIYLNSTSVVPIHFSMDHDDGQADRLGELYWYNNTFHELNCPSCSTGGQYWTLFDTTAGGGTYYPQTEFQNVQIYNNVIWMDDPSQPIFQWNNYDSFIGTAGLNLLPTNWGTNNQAGGSGTGWRNTGSGLGYEYQGASNLASHLYGFTSANLLTTASMPFNVTSYIPLTTTPLSAPLPSQIQNMPVRFAFSPAVGYPVPRNATPYVGAVDTGVTSSSSATGLTVSPNPGTAGQAVVFTATVAGGSGVPSGTVTFFNGAASLGTGALNGLGVATLSSAAPAAGTYTITAQYGGNASYAASISNAVSLTIKAVAAGTASSTTGLTVSPNPGTAGQAVVFTATVAGGSGVPSGTVTFFNGTVSVGTGALNGLGVATLSSAALAAGTYRIRAKYAGNTNYGASRSNAVSLTIRIPRVRKAM